MEKDLLHLLPQKFTHKLKNNINSEFNFYSNVDSAETCNEWMKHFSQLSSTSWIVRRTRTSSDKILLR